MATSPCLAGRADDTDLVKDGAAAIRTLGNAIDTSMGISLAVQLVRFYQRHQCQHGLYLGDI